MSKINQKLILMVEDVVPMAGTSRMADDEVPISVEGSSRMAENQMPVGSVVTFFLNYWTKDKIFIIISRFHSAYWHTYYQMGVQGA